MNSRESVIPHRNNSSTRADPSLQVLSNKPIGEREHVEIAGLAEMTIIDKRARIFYA
jgi:hypothetical protein